MNGARGDSSRFGGRSIHRLACAAVLLAAGGLLTGCAERTVTVTKVETVRQDVPTPLRVCQPAPIVPACETQKCVAAYLVRLSAAGDDCRATVARVKEWAERSAPAPSAAVTDLQLSAVGRFFLWLGAAAGTVPVALAMGPE
jgi:hypothetical protein